MLVLGFGSGSEISLFCEILKQIQEQEAAWLPHHCFACVYLCHFRLGLFMLLIVPLVFGADL
jgi:hypothetical protein